MRAVAIHGVDVFSKILGGHAEFPGSVTQVYWAYALVPSGGTVMDNETLTRGPTAPNLDFIDNTVIFTDATNLAAGKQESGCASYAINVP